MHCYDKDPKSRPSFTVAVMITFGAAGGAKEPLWTPLAGRVDGNPSGSGPPRLTLQPGREHS